jgi:hypothetical protein
VSLRRLDGRLKQLEPPPVDSRAQTGIRVLAVSPDGEKTEIHRFIIPRGPIRELNRRRVRRF